LRPTRIFLDVLGYRLEEVKGKHHSVFVPAAQRDGAAYRDFWAALNRGEYQAGEFKRIAKGGREVWIEASYNPVLDADGKPAKVVKFAADITQKKIRSMADASKIAALDRAQAMIEFNLDGSIVTANENFLTAMGYGLGEIQGKHHGSSCPRPIATVPLIARSGRRSTAANTRPANTRGSARAGGKSGSWHPTIRSWTKAASHSAWSSLQPT
jgi:PAS domain S-box-containing protein